MGREKLEPITNHESPITAILAFLGCDCRKGRKLLLDILTGADGTDDLFQRSLCHGHDDLEDLLTLLALELVNRHPVTP